MSDFDIGVDRGAIVTLETLLSSINEHNYTADNIKSILQAMLDGMNYESDAKADNFTEEQFNHD